MIDIKTQEIINDQITMHNEKMDLLEKILFWIRIIGVYFLFKIIITIIFIMLISKAGIDIFQLLENIT